jgi:predicted metalloprotease
MRLDDERESDNVEDRRGESSGAGFNLGAGHFGLGGIVLALVVSYFTGISPSTLLSLVSGGASPQTTSQSAPAHKPPANDEMATFVSKVLADTEDTWQVIFRETKHTYRDPKLVLFSGATQTACGAGQAAMGPFYCPLDEKVYIDLAFYQELKDRFHAPGEFAEAYVIAHEVGHHVQKLLGISDKVHSAQERAGSQAQANALSVRLELQADCFAGVWGNRADSMKHIIEPGEIDQALKAATAIGDDHLQQQAQGTIRPETFTHGSSAQRVRWFKRGMETGQPSQCNTFSVQSL